jgi:acetyl-CoA decarbonylase/synthase, CODH/ACS complex subunit gamma
MALSGIQIYKLLPQTNCKECGFPTCLAFAMKLAAKQVELSLCPYVSETSKNQLAESSAPPIRLVTVSSKSREVKAGNEVVLYRHEKTFFNKPGLFIRIRDDEPADSIREKVKVIDAYVVNYVGIELKIDGLAIKAVNNVPGNFQQVVKVIRETSQLPLILESTDPKVIAAGLSILQNENPLIFGANAQNLEEMASLAKETKASLVVSAPGLDELASLTEKVKLKGFEDIVLDPEPVGLGDALIKNTQIRRLAIKKNFKALGFPVIVSPPTPEAAAQAITKYASFIIYDEFSPELVYPLLVLRQNIYTDPQKPIQVQPGLYEINNPQPDSPVLVTTNFSITYFSVANEVEGSGFPAWLLVTDAEGMSVLTAWAAGKFDAERIAKSIKAFNVAEKSTRKLVVLPGHVAVLSGELEAELPGWQIRVGPREAVDIPKFMKLNL